MTKHTSLNSPLTCGTGIVSNAAPAAKCPFAASTAVEEGVVFNHYLSSIYDLATVRQEQGNDVGRFTKLWIERLVWGAK